MPEGPKEARSAKKRPDTGKNRSAKIGQIGKERQEGPIEAISAKRGQIGQERPDRPIEAGSAKRGQIGQKEASNRAARVPSACESASFSLLGARAEEPKPILVPHKQHFAFLHEKSGTQRIEKKHEINPKSGQGGGKAHGLL